MLVGSRLSLRSLWLPHAAVRWTLIFSGAYFSEGEARLDYLAVRHHRDSRLARVLAAPEGLPVRRLLREGEVTNRKGICGMAFREAPEERRARARGGRKEVGRVVPRGEGAQVLPGERTGRAGGRGSRKEIIRISARGSLLASREDMLLTAIPR